MTELRQYLAVAQAYNINVLLQEIIPGPAPHLYGIRGYLDQHSQLVALMADQKIHQPRMFTNNSVKRSIPLTVDGIPQAVQILITYLQCMQYTGLFHSEWKKDPCTNELKLLEINARSSGGNHFGAQCGINHILMAYRGALGERLETQTTYNTGIYQINLVSDLQVLLSKLVKSSWSNWSLTPYLNKKVWHTFAYNDPRPFLQLLRQTPV
jgi:predicted ATP-grasp superfamily ATP-dependent carboligase